MGWYYEYGASRKNVIAELTKGWTAKNGSSNKTIRKSTAGNVLWTVEETTTPEGEAKRFIGCYLMQRSDIGWGYKPMCESMGPYYYTCPKSYLDLVPVACQSWRDGVKAYWKKRSRKLKVGTTYRLKGSMFETVRITRLRPLRGIAGGREYKIPKRLVGEEIIEVSAL